MGLRKILSLKNYLAVGLMSGTSMDGIDAALVGMQAAGEKPQPELLAFRKAAYPREQRDALMDLAMGHQCTAEEIATLNTSVAVAFANSFFDVCKEAGVSPGEVNFIGSHGQTVAHVPPGSSEKPISGTLQIGSPGMIAALTGVTTVGDFRAGDIALGGQGAPLAPYADFLLRRNPKKSRVILNIGGIANATYLSKGGGLEDTVAFDTGPGNMVCDAIYRGLYPGKGEFDSNGEKAGKGKADEAIVSRFLEMPFFQKKPPKSAGHGEFGVHFAWEFLSQSKNAGLKGEDIMASALALTAVSITSAIENYIKPLGDVDEVFLSGGGARNRVLEDMLRRALSPAKVTHIDELGIPAESKEAVDFAVLARETLLGRTNVIASVTGASKSLVLGTIAPGSNL